MVGRRAAHAELTFSGDMAPLCAACGCLRAGGLRGDAACGLPTREAAIVGQVMAGCREIMALVHGADLATR